MFARRNRLSREEIELTKSTGRSVSASLFNVRFLLNGSKKVENKAKFSFVMSKKEEKTAVGRNKAKRRFRSALREVSHSLKDGLYVFFLKKPLIEAKFSDIRTEIKAVFSKKSLFKS